MCHELEDLSFRYLYPNRYHVLAKAVRATRGTRREVIAHLKKMLVEKLHAAGIEASVFGREKNLYSIYRKMQEKNIPFSEVLDIYGFRVIVKDTLTCYMALGILHSLFKPVPGRIKDYIALPKANGYQSLHSTLLGPNGMPIEIQIRTWEMHRLAEVGVAAHWLYKTGGNFTDVQKKAKQWLHSLLQIQSEAGDPLEFLENIKVDLFPDEIYVFSPKGEIIALPRGATPVDFAFAVHSEIGKHCVAAKINHELAPLRTELKTGDQVEIITSEHAKPSPAWLGFVVTGKARSQIRHFLRTMRFEESAALGEKLLQQALKSIGVEIDQINEDRLQKYLQEQGIVDQKSFFADIGLGKRLPMVVAHQLTSDLPVSEKKPTAIPISGTEGIAIQLATCCHPIPGDAIVGQIKKGKGLIVHTRDCTAISWKRWRDKSEEWLDCVWDTHKTKGLFNVKIRVTVPNKPGELAKIAALIASGGSNITHVHMEKLDGGEISTLDFTLQVANRVHLANLIRTIRKHPEVISIARG
jgi:GTP pyrophosphokinase